MSEPVQTREELLESVGVLVSDAEGMGYLDPKAAEALNRHLAATVEPVAIERDRLASGLDRICDRWFMRAFAGLSLRTFMTGISQDLYDLRFDTVEGVSKKKVPVASIGDAIGTDQRNLLRRAAGGTDEPGLMRRFHLERNEDKSGVSGVGRVAEGVQFSDGTCAVRWLSSMPTTTIFSDISHVAGIHGHGGSTNVIWDDDIAG